MSRRKDGTCKLEIGVAGVERAKKEFQKLDWVEVFEDPKSGYFPQLLGKSLNSV